MSNEFYFERLRSLYQGTLDYRDTVKVQFLNNLKMLPFFSALLAFFVSKFDGELILAPQEAIDWFEITLCINVGLLLLSVLLACWSYLVPPSYHILPDGAEEARHLQLLYEISINPKNDYELKEIYRQKKIPLLMTAIRENEISNSAERRRKNLLGYVLMTLSLTFLMGIIYLTSHFSLANYG